MTARSIKWILLGILLWLPVWLQGQSLQHLTLQQAIDLSAQQNSKVQTAEIDQRIAKANRHQTDALFIPQVSVGYQALLTNDPLNAFGFLLQQRQVSSADFAPSTLNKPGNAHNYAATVEFQIPLLNMDRIYMRKGAKLNEEISGHQSQRTKEYIRFEVKKAYTYLQLAYQSRMILDSTLQDVKHIHQSVSNFYEQGLVHKSDVLNAQVQVNTIETALSKAESNIANASDGLRLLLGETDQDEIYQTDPLQQHLFRLGNQEFSTNRSDILAMSKAVKATKMNAKSAAMAFVPSINAFGNYQFNDDKVFRFKEDSYLLGISLKWNLSSGNQNRSRFRAATLQREKMQKDFDFYLEQSRLEVDKNRREIADLQLEIQKQKTSVEQAAEALRIMSDRHREGLVSTTDLLLAQAQLSQQRLTLAQSISNFNIACFYQEILTQSH